MVGPIQQSDIEGRCYARGFSRPDLASTHPSAPFCHLRTSTIFMQLLNDVVTKSIIFVIFPWWAPFNKVILKEDVTLEGFQGQIWLQCILPLLYLFLDFLFSLSNN